MKRSLAMLLVPLAMSACEHPVSRAEFEALQVSNDSLEVRLERVRDWAAAMSQWALADSVWAHTTGNVICDIFAKNPPSSPYSPETRDYCGPGDPGPNDPPPPPEWGG